MKKYIITFLITSAIFLSAFFISDLVNNSRLEQLSTVQETISLNILATETRFALLKESSCENIFEGSSLEIGITNDLNQLVTRIKFLENELGSDNTDVIILKRKYTLLQMKDFLLVRELEKKCNYKIPTVLYFYTTDCADCRKQSIVLDQIRADNSYVRVYWMDSSVEEGTLDTLERLSGVTEYPTLVLGENTYVGFQTYEDFSAELQKWATENSALLNEIDTEAIIEEGIEYIKQEFKFSGEMESQTYTDGKYRYTYVDTMVEDEQENEFLFETVLEYNFTKKEFILVSRNQINQEVQ